MHSSSLSVPPDLWLGVCGFLSKGLGRQEKVWKGREEKGGWYLLFSLSGCYARVRVRVHEGLQKRRAKRCGSVLLRGSFDHALHEPRLQPQRNCGKGVLCLFSAESYSSATVEEMLRTLRALQTQLRPSVAKTSPSHLITPSSQTALSWLPFSTTVFPS